MALKLFKATSGESAADLAQLAKHMQYYAVQRNWRKIKRHLDNEEVNAILERDFSKFARGHMRFNPETRTWARLRGRFSRGMYPCEFENCDWRFEDRSERRGPQPAYWRYVCWGASHWLVNYNLKLAQLVEPNREWRVLTGMHSTVWDGEHTLFDLNYQALGIDPADCFLRSCDEELPPGEQIRVGQPCTHEEQEEHQREKVNICISSVMIGRNPSKLGAAWAWCRVDEQGERVAQENGLVMPKNLGIATVTKNVADLHAVASALRSLPDGWSGKVLTDSAATCACIADPSKTVLDGMPSSLADDLHKHCKRLRVTAEVPKWLSEADPAWLPRETRKLLESKRLLDALCQTAAGKARKATA